MGEGTTALNWSCVDVVILKIVLNLRPLMIDMLVCISLFIFKLQMFCSCQGLSIFVVCAGS